MNDIVERSVFGQTITWTNYVSEDEALSLFRELIKKTISEVQEEQAKAEATDEKKSLLVNRDGKD